MREDACPERACHRAHLHVAVLVGPSLQGDARLHDLVPFAQVEQEPHAFGSRPRFLAAETAAVAEVDGLAVHRQGGLGPFQQSDPLTEVGVGRHHVQGVAGTPSDIEGVVEVRDAVQVTQLAAGVAAQVQPHERHGLGAGQLERSFGPIERFLRTPGEHLGFRSARVQLGQREARFVRGLQELDRLVERGARRRGLALQAQLVVQAPHGARGGLAIARGERDRDGLAVGGHRLIRREPPGAPRRAGGLPDQLGPLGAMGRRELGRPGEVVGRPGGVQGLLATAGHDEEPQGGVLEGGQLLREARGPSQVEGPGGVGGEQVGALADAVTGRFLQPHGHRQVHPGAGGPREPAVGDIADQSMGERELGLLRDRAEGGAPDHASSLQLAE